MVLLAVAVLACLLLFTASLETQHALDPAPSNVVAIDHRLKLTAEEIVRRLVKDHVIMV